MLAVSNLEYDSPATLLFQRLSVSVSGLVLAAAMLYATRVGRLQRANRGRTKGQKGQEQSDLLLFVLVVANAGLIMVDNIHFQYNGILLGAWAGGWGLSKGWRHDLWAGHAGTRQCAGCTLGRVGERNGR